MNPRTRNLLILTAPVIVLIGVAGLIYWYLIYRREGIAVGLLPDEIGALDLVLCAAAVACSMGVLYGFMKLIPMKMMYDPNVRLLGDMFSNRFLAVYFIPNAFYKELIFRGALLPIIDPLASTFLFTAVHFSYYKKPVLLVEVFIQGLILSGLFMVTGSVWITTLAHTAINTIEMWLIKSGRIKYEEGL